MATGRRAFTGSTSAVVSAAILGQEPAAPRVLRGDLPVRLEDAILKLLEKDRLVRCQSAAELRADLLRVRRQMQSESARVVTPVGSDGVRGDPPVSDSPAAHATAVAASSDAQLISGLIGRHRKGLGLGAVVLAGVLCVVGYVLWRLAVTTPAGSQAGASSNIVVQPLTFTGNATHGAISPDGKFVAYVRSDEQSLWVRQTSTGNDVQIIPKRADTDILSVTVTPDSSYVDFVVRKNSTEYFADLWRVPFLGGTPRKLASGVYSGIGWSPDGRRMAFVRRSRGENSFESMVMIADADGSSERILARRIPPKYFGESLGWSPDGSAIGVIGSTEGRLDSGNTNEILVLDAATGAERENIAGPADLTGLAWLDDAHLLAMRDTATTTNTQPMIVDLRRRTAAALTRDLATYEGVSLTADRLTAVSTRTDTRGGVWLGDALGEQMAAVVPESSAAPEALSVSNTGVVAYEAPSLEAASAIWAVRSGESPHIVVGRGGPSWPAIAPQGDVLVFASEDPAGIYQFLRHSADQGERHQRRSDYDDARRVDGAFRCGLPLVVLSVAGGKAREIFSRSSVNARASVSTDGRLIVFATAANDRHLRICDMPECARAAVFDGPFLRDADTAAIRD